MRDLNCARTHLLRLTPLSLCLAAPAGCDAAPQTEDVIDSDGDEAESEGDEIEPRWSTPWANYPTLMSSMHTDPGGRNGGCWDTSGNGSHSRTFQQYRCHGRDNQLWTFEPVGSNFRIHPKNDSNRCVDVPGFNFVNGMQLQTYPCNGGVNQLWRVVNHNSQSATIRPATRTNFCMEIHDAVKTTQSPIQIGFCNGQPFQAFRFHDWVGQDTSLSCDWGRSMRFGPEAPPSGSRRSFPAGGHHFNTVCAEHGQLDSVSCDSYANWFVVDNPWGSNDWDVRCFRI